MANSDSPYANISTSPTLIQVRLSDAGTMRNLIVENDSFKAFLMDAKLVEEDDYVGFMEKHEGRPIEGEVAAYVRWLAEHRFRNKDLARHYIEQTTFDEAYTLQQSGFADREELLAAYFNFKDGLGILRPKGQWGGKLNPWDPRFIALLIDLGMIVRQGDVAPILFVQFR